jgi:hypothetical protein
MAEATPNQVARAAHQIMFAYHVVRCRELSDVHAHCRTCLLLDPCEEHQRKVATTSAHQSPPSPPAPGTDRS